MFLVLFLERTERAHAGFEDSLGVGPERQVALGGSFAARGKLVLVRLLQPRRPLATRRARAAFSRSSAGLVYAHPTLHVTGPEWAARSLTAAIRPERLAEPRHVAGKSVADTGGFLVGTRFSVGKPFKIEGLNLGLSLFIPGQLFRWTTRPDDDVQWALMEDRTQVISVHAGLGYRINRFLSLGVGVRVLFNAQTNTTGEVTSTTIDPATGNLDTSAQLGTDSQVYAQVYPIVGALITPFEWLRIGVVYRNASYVNDWGTTRINGVPDLGTIGYPTHFAHYYEPLEITLAASVDLGKTIDVSADVTYNRWSDALSTNLNFWGGGRWGDTVTPAFGVRWQAAPPLAVMAGYRFQKSPIDNFGGPSNLLDCDRHVESVGLDLHLGKLFRAPDFDLHLKGAPPIHRARRSQP